MIEGLLVNDPADVTKHPQFYKNHPVRCHPLTPISTLKATFIMERIVVKNGKISYGTN
jgi:hypothetical protein